MGFIDKMCYEVATTIIIDIFLTKYIPTIKDNISWYENLNTFISIFPTQKPNYALLVMLENPQIAKELKLDIHFKGTSPYITI